jgi:hypothetical protein
MTQESQIKLELIYDLLKKIDERHLDFVLQVVQGEFIPAGENGSLENMKQYARAELTHATQGPASEADAAARLAICMACEHRAVEYKGMTDAGNIGWCTKCGCGNNPRALLTVKVTLAGVECPLAKWGKVNGTGATVASAVDAVAGVAKSIIHKLGGG